MEDLLKSYSEDYGGTESEEPDVFARIYVQHFLERFHFFLDKCDQMMESLDGKKFVCMPFEYEVS